MLPSIPDNLDPDQKKRYLKAWWNIFNLVLGIISCTLIGVCLVLIFSVFDLNIDLTWNKISRPITVKNVPLSTQEEDWDRIENGIHVSSGLYVDKNFELVRANCTACHSGKLIAQNKATREGWEQMIRWMQATQGLWDLGNKEPRILDYLEKYYAPQEVGRRANIDIANVEWYILNIDE